MVIDERYRVNWVVSSLSSINEDKGFDNLIKRGFRKIDFVEMASMCDFKTQTSIFIELIMILVSNNKKKFRGVLCSI